MLYEYFWDGYLAAKVVRCCALDVSSADVKKDDRLMVTLEKNHSVCVKTTEEQNFGFLVDVDAMLLYPILQDHVYTNKIDIVAFANSDIDGSDFEVNIKIFTHYYEVGDPKLMAIERKIHTLFP